jgi:hypothetical protein
MIEEIAGAAGAPGNSLMATDVITRALWRMSMKKM